MSIVAEAVDGFGSAVVGYVIGILVPAFLTVFAALNSPWYFTLLFIVYVAIAIVAEVVNGVFGSVGYAAGFLYGSYTLGDWPEFLLALVASVTGLYLKFKE